MSLEWANYTLQLSTVCNKTCIQFPNIVLFHRTNILPPLIPTKMWTAFHNCQIALNQCKLHCFCAQESGWLITPLGDGLRRPYTCQQNYSNFLSVVCRAFSVLSFIKEGSRCMGSPCCIYACVYTCQPSSPLYFNFSASYLANSNAITSNPNVTLHGL